MSEYVILAPRGKSEEPDIPIDLEYWAKLEARISEVATVTPTKAPELLATFNRAALKADELANSLEFEQQIAARESDKIKAQILLDDVPKILAEKGLSTNKSPLGSEDLREAIINSNAKYTESIDRQDQLKALTKMFRTKYNAFERAFRSVKSLVAEQTFNFGKDSRTSGDSGDGEPGIRATASRSGTGGTFIGSGFGHPKY
jgi:hypothetical protein